MSDPVEVAIPQGRQRMTSPLLKKLDTTITNRPGKRGEFPATRDSVSSLSSSDSARDIPTGWATAPQLLEGWTSRSTFGSCSAVESPITPVSCSEGRIGAAGYSVSPCASFTSMSSLTIRPKNAEPADGGSDPDAPEDGETHGLPSQQEGCSKWLSSCQQTPLQEVANNSALRPPSPIRRDRELRNFDNAEDDHRSEVPDISALVPEEDTTAEDLTDRVLHQNLVMTYGLSAQSTSRSLPACRAVVRDFLENLTWALEEDDCNIRQVAGLDRFPASASGSSSVTRSSQNSSQRSDRGKRKGRPGSNRSNQDDQNSDEEGIMRPGGSSTTKRAKLDPLVRMSCPYRKKNPLRFNVRDHRLCALTVFTDTAELRRHIQECHRRPIPSPHVCLRCRTRFSVEEDLRQHQLFRDGLCEVIPEAIGCRSSEDGIDNETVDKLRCKRGRVSDSIEVQWRKIWELLFPETPVTSYEYCAVMEHYELHEKYCAGIPSLLNSLSHVGLSARGLETLGSILNNHFMELLGQCDEENKYRDYRTRSCRAPQSTPGPQGRKQPSLARRLGAAHRDSAVDVASIAANVEGDRSWKSPSRPSSSIQVTPSLVPEYGGQLPDSMTHLALGGGVLDPVPEQQFVLSSFDNLTFVPSGSAAQVPFHPAGGQAGAWLHDVNSWMPVPAEQQQPDLPLSLSDPGQRYGWPRSSIF